jgi:ribosome biogenesis GTPase / thiamine phosphate phosphatase
MRLLEALNVDPILKSLGWNAFFGQAFLEFASDHEPGRVSTVTKTGCKVHLKTGEVNARIPGKLRKDGLLPAVGDWVAVSRDTSGTYIIGSVLPRKSRISRKDAGRATGEQVIAANVDTAFIVTSLNKDLNLRRLERYLAAARQNTVEPVIILSKSDVCPDVEGLKKEVTSIAPGVPVLAVSAIHGDGLGQLAPYLTEGRTVVLLGSSGVGKSTLINALEGYGRQKVGDIREDDSRGRHTTTARELIIMENGGVIIDNPGMRELQLWDAEDGISETFKDIEELATQCKFSDCRHETEPGCAIKKALADGTLSEVRLESYHKLQREMAALERKKNPELMAAERKRWKKLMETGQANRRSKERGL